MFAFRAALGAWLVLLGFGSAPVAAQPASRPTPSASRPARPTQPPRRAPRRPVTAAAPVAAALGVTAATAATAATVENAGPQLPTDPAPAPPTPAALGAAPRREQPAPEEPAIVLPHGLEALSGGAFRVTFPAGEDSVAEPAADALGQLGRRLAAHGTGRVTLLAWVSGPEADVSAARRRSLARGLAVKAALVAGGLPTTRIDLRPLGRGAPPADAVEITPPPAPAAAAAAR